MAKKQEAQTDENDADELDPADKKEGDGEEGEEGEEGAEGAPKKSSRKKMIVMGAGALVLLLGAGGGLYFSGMLGGKEDEHAALAAAEKAVFYTLPEFLVNLNTGTKSSSFLKTTVILEVARQEDIPMIEANLPRLVDAVNTYLRELRASDLSGSAGLQRLREELLIRANKSLAPVKINDVLFKEIVIQ